jgi:hypothetical protein
MIRGCRHEDDVRAAAASGRWPAELAAHAASCENCAEVRQITLALAPLAGPTPPPAEVEPRAIFACARHVRRINVESKISFITTLTNGLVLAALAAVLLSFVKWPTLAVAWTAASQGQTWMYATTGLLLAGLIGLSRWMSEER